MNDWSSTSHKTTIVSSNNNDTDNISGSQEQQQHQQEQQREVMQQQSIIVTSNDCVDDTCMKKPNNATNDNIKIINCNSITNTDENHIDLDEYEYDDDDNNLRNTSTVGSQIHSKDYNNKNENDERILNSTGNDAFVEQVVTNSLSRRVQHANDNDDESNNIIIDTCNDDEEMGIEIESLIGMIIHIVPEPEVIKTKTNGTNKSKSEKAIETQQQQQSKSSNIQSSSAVESRNQQQQQQNQLQQVPDNEILIIDKSLETITMTTNQSNECDLLVSTTADPSSLITTMTTQQRYLQRIQRQRNQSTRIYNTNNNNYNFETRNNENTRIDHQNQDDTNDEHQSIQSYNENDDYEIIELDPYTAYNKDCKYKSYNVPVSHDEGDRAIQIKLNSFQRPHMRSFHCAWISFFLSFTIWFTISPLLKEIQYTLKLSKKQIWTSSILNDIAAIILRIIVGPICDAYGARIPMAIVLVCASIPCSMIGLIQNVYGLYIIRFCIGIAGCSFVMSQFWPSRMFAREISGTANGIIGGWGNFGSAFIQLLIGRILFPIVRDYHLAHSNNTTTGSTSSYDSAAETSWRQICIIPAIVAFSWGCIVAFISDDAPVGNYNEMRKHGTMDRILFTTSIKTTARFNTFILYIQYACCFGVEIVMNNGAVLYFYDQFGLSTEDGSTLAFAYGSMNLLFRGLGGYLSDYCNLYYGGIRGRLWLQSILLLCEGIVIILFSYTHTLGGAIVSMIIFSIFTQSSEGAIFGVVPYVSKLYTGSVSGLVGSGGSMGSVIYGLLFQQLQSYRHAFLIMGICVILSSTLSIFIKINCHATILHGYDHISIINARSRFLARRRRGQQIYNNTITANTTNNIDNTQNNTHIQNDTNNISTTAAGAVIGASCTEGNYNNNNNSNRNEICSYNSEESKYDI